MFVQALTVPIQGFLNALAYGWTRGDFRSVMSSHHQVSSRASSSSHGAQEESEEEEDTDVEDLIENKSLKRTSQQGNLSVLIS